MVRNLLLTFLAFFSIAQIAMAQSSTSTLEGRIIDDLGDGVPFANVAVLDGENIVRGVETDIDGNYAITNLNPGTYNVQYSYIGYQTQRQEGVQLLANRIVRLDVSMKPEGVLLDPGIEVVAYKVPLIQVDETSSGGIKTAEDIKNLPIKNITGIAATTAGVTTRGDDTNIRGARAESTVFILDGIVTRGALPPQTEIEQLELITGGLEAKYGDVIGGVISLTSKGPSSQYSGYIEGESSQLTDAFGYNLLNASFSGPLLKNSEGKSILGFRLSGQYRRQEDDSPSGVGVYRATEDAIADLTADPDVFVGSSRLARADFLQPEDVELLEARPNEREIAMDFTGKLDMRISDAVDLTLSGTYNTRDDRFTPTRARIGDGLGNGSWSLLNHVNNPLDQNSRIRGNVRLRHRIGYNNQTVGEDGERNEQSIIGGLTYSIQVGYERFQREIGDWQHGDNLFNYGYVGNFDVQYDNSLVQVDSTLANYATRIFNPNVGQFGEDEYWMHTGFTENLVNYTPGNVNPAKVNQNANLEGEVLGNILDYNFYNGLQENGLSNPFFGVFSNVGSVYDRFSKTEFDQYTGNVQISLDLYPSKSKANRHAVEFGFLYEQRTNRFWRADPTELWLVARQQANIHLNFVDTLGGAIGMEELVLPYGTIDVPIYNSGLVESTINEGNGLFWQRIRESQGVGLNQQINVDGLNPSDLDIGMFSASELTERDIVSYYGFDYAGNRTTGNVTFDDFFTSTIDADGLGLNREIRNFPVAPLQPIYWAAFIQDKFSVKDVIFKLGVRVDRYDANTKVLRDPFSLYAIQNRADFYDLNPELTEITSVPENASVYVADEGSTEVVGFRVGDQWFNESGEAVINADQVFQGNVVRAALVNPESDIQGDDFDINGSFRDYEPQINVAPRVAISFPISDVANFFAHYDVLVQRPGFGQTNATALQYYFFNRNAGFIDNPNLRPQKTIDYEVGFKQKVTNTSALTLAAYYRELRDLIQLRNFRDLPQSQNNSVPEYLSYDNIDFGTTYGFTAQWDMRRTGNLQMNINYTLAFADGTGSDVNSSNDFNDNLRVLSPLSFDERHSINVIADYRYASGNAYNGPKIGDAELFANTGLNIQTNLISGRPYSRSQLATQLPNSAGAGFLGSINGARLPWVFNVDARLDRTINLSKAGAKNPLSLNLYVRVTNLFDRENVIGVFSATGSPDDDGFLLIEEGERLVQNLDAAQRASFLNAYNYAQLAPGFFTAPRRIFLGAIFQF